MEFQSHLSHTEVWLLMDSRNLKSQFYPPQRYALDRKFSMPKELFPNRAESLVDGVFSIAMFAC